MSFLGKVKDFFLPSEAVSAKRRLDVFGTESKAVAGTVIVGSAAALIAAPALIASGGGTGAVLRSAGNRLVATKTTTKLGLAVAAPVVAGVVVGEPKTVTRTVGGIANFESNLYQVAKDPSIQNFKDVFVENPVIASGAAIAGVAALGVGLGGAATIANTLAVKENTKLNEAKNFVQDVVLPSTSGGFPTPQNSNNASPLEAPPEEPLTPQTQIMGREVTGAPRKRRAARMRADRPVRVYNRVNILNQQIDK